MKISQAHVVTFSPTGTTTANLMQFVDGMNVSDVVVTDLTLPSDETPSAVTGSETLAVIGAPVYSGRVAPVAVSRLAAMQGNGTPAVVAVAYGNRAYENALIELKALAEQAGFVVVGALAVLGQHSFSSDGKPIAQGRPDAADDACMHQFGAAVMEKLAEVEALGALSELTVPGELPQEVFGGSKGICPEVDSNVCGACGECVSACPVGAITLKDDTAVIDAAVCTFCCACVQGCPNKAVTITVEKMVNATNWLHANCQERKEPELYI